MTRTEFERNDPGCREINQAALTLNQRVSLRRDLLDRRLDRQHHRRQRAEYLIGALVAVFPFAWAGIR